MSDPYSQLEDQLNEVLEENTDLKREIYNLYKSHLDITSRFEQSNHELRLKISTLKHDLSKLERKWRDFGYTVLVDNPDDTQSWSPGSPYDRGRWECANDIHDILRKTEE